ncbi:MAG: hypothetical protein E6J17_02025 [Chloroflexi bacterium]|nr:MAG: hypothetical protein E6J17_02025 [Chloroflexota bacterium]
MEPAGFRRGETRQGRLSFGHGRSPGRRRRGSSIPGAPRGPRPRPSRTADPRPRRRDPAP